MVTGMQRGGAHSAVVVVLPLTPVIQPEFSPLSAFVSRRARRTF